MIPAQQVVELALQAATVDETIVIDKTLGVYQALGAARQAAPSSVGIAP